MVRTLRTLLFLSSASLLSAQSPKPAVTPADYGKWETLGQPVLAHDGKWLAAPIRRNNGTFEVRIYQVAQPSPRIAASASEPAFSADNRWIAYAVGYSEAEEDKLKKAKKPVQNKLDILDLTSAPPSQSTMSRASPSPIKAPGSPSAATRLRALRPQAPPSLPPTLPRQTPRARRSPSAT